MSDDAAKYPWGVIPPPPFPNPATEGQKVEETEAVREEKTAETPPAIVEAVVEQTEQKKHRIVRGSGDPIYLIKDGRRHWIQNAVVMSKLGLRFGDEEKVPQSELSTFLPGEAITLENWQKYE